MRWYNFIILDVIYFHCCKRVLLHKFNWCDRRYYCWVETKYASRVNRTNWRVVSKSYAQVIRLVEILQKLSTSRPCDSSGVFLVRVFHIYQHNFGTVGSFLKASVRVRKPRSRLRRKKKIKSFLVRARYPLRLPDTATVVYSTNACLVLKKRLQVRGRVIFGPTTYLIKRRKFLKSFARVL